MEQEIENGKNKVLADLKDLIHSGRISKDEVLNIFGKEEKKEGPQNAVKTLYFVGGFIIVLGVGIFVQQFWVFWDQIMKVIFALGLTAALYGIGYYLHYRQPNLSIFSNVSFILSAFLLPLGVGTFLDLLGVSATTNAGLSINFAVIFIAYYISYLALKYDVFLIFATASASSLFISFTNLLVGGNPSSEFYEFRFLALGASLFSFGYYFESRRKKIVNFFYFFGLISLLGSAFALSIQSNFWLFIFPFMLAGGFYASTVLQNRLILSLATLFTFLEIGRLTSEYFSRSLGWPITLIVAGFGIILVAYFSYKVGKKYSKT